MRFSAAAALALIGSALTLTGLSAATLDRGGAGQRTDPITILSSGSTGDASSMCVQTDGSPICRPQKDRATDNQVQFTDYGGKCDGVSDDGPALSQASAVAASLGGRDLVFPPGRCRLLSDVVGPSNTRWLSRSGTTFYLDPAAKLSKSADKAPHVIVFRNVSDISIDGISFEGAGQSTPPGGTTAGLLFDHVTNVKVVNSAFRNLGQLARNPGDTPIAYVHGVLTFGGSNFLFDNDVFDNTAGGGLAFSNGTSNVEVRNSRFSGNADSAITGTIGCFNHAYHDNFIAGLAGQSTPIIVMDRCWNWTIHNNQVVGLPSASGAFTAQGIMVDRYGDTPETNHDFSINNNVISNTSTSIQIGSTGTRQGSRTVPGGGRFTVNGNVGFNTSTFISVSDSEVGSITGNVGSGISDNGLLIAAYSKPTGSLSASANILAGNGKAGSYGIRQLATNGALTPSSISLGNNTVTGFNVPASLYAGNQPPSAPAGAPTSDVAAACQQGQILGVDASFVYVCRSFGVLGKLPIGK